MRISPDYFILFFPKTASKARLNLRSVTAGSSIDHQPLSGFDFLSVKQQEWKTCSIED